jgi:hypothetical protein
MKKSLPITALAVLLGGSTLGGAPVLAQSQQTALYDPAQLPATKGVVKQYTLGPRGDVDGLILVDGTDVKIAPYLSSETVFTVHPGDAVTIRGLKARALPLIDAAAITNDRTGLVVSDQGGPGPRPEEATELITGKVVGELHGKRGEVNGAVMEDGAMLRLPPPEADRLSDLLQPGKTIFVRGTRSTSVLGTVIEASAIGPSPDRLSAVAGPRGPLDGPPDRGPPPPPDGRPPPPPPPRG